MHEEEIKIEPKNQTAAEFDFSVATAIRIGNCYENIDDYWRLKQYESLLHELMIVFRNLSPFMREFKNGQYTNSPEYQTATTLKNNCYNELFRCSIPTKNGHPFFAPTLNFINYLSDFDEYLRAVALKAGLYMRKYDDETGIPPLARKAKLSHSW